MFYFSKAVEYIYLARKIYIAFLMFYLHLFISYRNFVMHILGMELDQIIHVSFKQIHLQ